MVTFGWSFRKPSECLAQVPSSFELFPALGDTPHPHHLSPQRYGSTWIERGDAGHLSFWIKGDSTHFSRDSSQPITSNFIRGFSRAAMGENVDRHRRWA